jgi:predicted metalloprotease
VNTGCGPATTAVGPFYCPVDQTAYFDTDFFQELVDRFGSSGGPFAQEYVVAHEYGHHVQNLQGVLGRSQQGAQGAGGNGVRTELQADCYAGIWAHYASTVKQESTGVPYLEPLSDKDIADALSAAASVGDDRIQKQATGRVNPESWTHGSSEQRQKWFTIGYQTGDPKQCDTFSAPDLG